jgi:hypothetical protein
MKQSEDFATKFEKRRTAAVTGTSEFYPDDPIDSAGTWGHD